MINDPITWAETALGGTVRSLSEVSGGKSRRVLGIELERGGETLDLILRQETGFGANSGTRFDLNREFMALQAIRNVRVKKPDVFALSEEGDMILMSRLPGQIAIPDDPALREIAVRSFTREIADLHSAPVDGIAFPFEGAESDVRGALNDLADWRDAYDRLCYKHTLIDESFDWLSAHAPQARGPAVIVHGDCGPGNFMHVDGELSGLVDWEFMHLGDPHEDLAWLWFRINILQQDTEADSYFRHYLARSNLNFDPARCLYYAAQTVLRCTVACGVRQFHDPKHDDTRPAQLRAMLKNVMDDLRDGQFYRMPQLPGSL